MNKDWERPKNVISPVWNNGYQRYDLSIDEIIEKIKDSGYELNKAPEEGEEDEDIDIEANYVLEIHSEKGYVVSETVALVLKPKVYKNGEDITDLLDMKYFKWVRSSSNEKDDAEWNLRHATGIKDLYITHEDVYKRAIFHCAFLTGISETQFVQNMYAAYMASIENK
jgi:hypothetical protein